MLKQRLRSGRRAEHGMTIVELMVGVAIGLIIVAAASLLMTNQLFENRRLLTEAQMQQDLRAAADIATREVRRAGINAESNLLNSLWYPGATQVLPGIMPNSLAVPSVTAVTFNYYPGPTAVPGPYGFSVSNDILKTTLNPGNPQDLTDGNVMRVTAFTPTLLTDSSAAIVLPCPTSTACTVGANAGTTNCWPTFQVRRVKLNIEAAARSASGVLRAMSSTVRLRNDNVRFSSEALPNQMCP